MKKENTELKKQQFSLRNERNTFLAQNEQYEKDLIDFNVNLTKAKEIIKSLAYIGGYSEYIDRGLSHYFNVMQEKDGENIGRIHYKFQYWLQD